MARKSRVITETQKQESTKAFEWKIGICRGKVLQRKVYHL